MSQQEHAENAENAGMNESEQQDLAIGWNKRLSKKKRRAKKRNKKK